MKQIVAPKPKGQNRVLLMASAIPGLFLYLVDLFMVPGYFDFGTILSLGVCFLIGLAPPLWAGTRYRANNGTHASVKATVLSPSVMLYLSGIVTISVAGYLSYTPKPKGY